MPKKGDDKQGLLALKVRVSAAKASPMNGTFVARLKACPSAVFTQTLKPRPWRAGALFHQPARLVVRPPQISCGGVEVGQQSDADNHASHATEQPSWPLFEDSRSHVEPVLDLVPVHDVPPVANVFRPAILIPQVVGVLPEVEAHDGVFALHQRVVLIGGGIDLQLAGLIPGQPCPARAKASGRGGGELLLELIEASEGALDGVGDFPLCLAAFARSHDLPEHGVVDLAAEVVAYGCADAFRNDGTVVGQEFLDALRGQLRRRLQGFVQVGDVGPVMLVVVDLHR